LVRQKIYQWLENPRLYRLAQQVLAPGGLAAVTREVRHLLGQLQPARLILDVGCGPSSFLSPLGLKPAGADLSRQYMPQFRRQSPFGVVARAEALPFSAQSFDGVWTMGLLHHLPDPAAAAAIREILRVCKIGGHVVLLDAVLPRSTWRRPLARLIRRLDRGEHMRTQTELESLLHGREGWSLRRYTYSLTGLEMLMCWKIKEKEMRS